MKNLLTGLLISCLTITGALAIGAPDENVAISCPAADAVSRGDVQGWITERKLENHKGNVIPYMNGAPPIQIYQMEHLRNQNPERLECEYLGIDEHLGLTATVKLHRNVRNCQNMVGDWEDEGETSFCLGADCQISCARN